MTPLSDPDRLNADGLAAFAAGDHNAAGRAYRQALALAPSYLAALGNLANLEGKLSGGAGDLTLAVLGYRRALTMMPRHPGLLMMLGTAQLKAGRMAEGEVHLRRALEIDPAYPKAHVNLGLHALQNRRLAEAERHLRLALKGDPVADLALAGLARALSEQPRFRDARRLARQAAALAPDSAQAHGAIGQVCMSAGDMIPATQGFRRALALSKNAAALTSLGFCLHYDPAASSSEIASLFRRWATTQSGPEPRPHANDPMPERRLRIGYLSADLYDHPVGRNVVGLIESHDPAEVEIHVYAEHQGDDAIVRRLKAATHVWRSTAGLDDATVAERIRSDGIDILLVLAGHTLQNRIAVAALKPAPIQLSMHDFTTTGLGQVGGFLSDPDLSPPGGEEEFSEDVVRLPCFYLHMPVEDVPVQPSNRKAGLLLGSCNNPAKLNDRVVALWSRTLLALPGARLALKYRDAFSDKGLVAEIQRRFERFGIPAPRLHFDGRRVDRRTHLAFVGSFDIALDPFPFNGCTTTYEALWMGVPVVTLAGHRFVGRASTAMLRQIDLADLATATEDGYLEAVGRLAADGARRELLRRTLRNRLKRSPLMDAASYARSVEVTYRNLWRRWCVART